MTQKTEEARKRKYRTEEMVRRTEKKNNKRTEKMRQPSGTWKMISKQKETRGERVAGCEVKTGKCQTIQDKTRQNRKETWTGWIIFHVLVLFGL